MRLRFFAIGLFAVAVATTGCNQAPPPVAAVPDTREADAKGLRELEEAWGKDFETRDPAKLLARYTDDATLMEPGLPPSHGKEAIAKTLKEMAADPSSSLRFHPTRVEVARSNDIAYTEGTYTMTMTNPVTKKLVHDKGSYVTTYRRVDGVWKAVSDIATSEAAPMHK